MSDKPKLIVIAGPTASGKTAAAIALAQKLQCPILSADSRQFFQEMTIGTAKPTPDELRQAEHVFVGHLSVAEDYSAGKFERDSLQYLQEHFKKSKVAILCGGSGLYIDALCFGMDALPKNESIREKLNIEFDIYGLERLQQELLLSDPAYYHSCDLQNHRRVIRALEVIRASGKKMSEYQQKKRKNRDFEVHYFVLNWERETLYQRINQRVDQMMQNGLLEEVQALVNYRQKAALQTVGYQEIFDYFDGVRDIQHAVESIKQNSRRYAKRQMTWFKKNPDAVWVTCKQHPDQEQNIAQLILDHLS
jgi:tRNA dimethylallyltransferase